MTLASSKCLGPDEINATLPGKAQDGGSFVLGLLAFSGQDRHGPELYISQSRLGGHEIRNYVISWLTLLKTEGSPSVHSSSVFV